MFKNYKFQLKENIMSLKNSYVTSDYIEWDTMLSLVRKLYRDKEYRLSLLIGCGSFFGLRISDILTLTWSMLLDDERFVIIEKKTGKRREIKINSNFQKHIADCYMALNITDKNEKCFISRKKMVYSTQRINVLFKSIKSKYNLKIEHFSTHSMRKTFGRKVVEAAGENSEFALIKLSELFNHADVMTTRKYLGLRSKELLETYDMLSF
ncbi:site-specific integrase [Bacteroides thetaiotaomicron]|uniref:Site-specific integrase n=3 Tax=Bacteroides TaxID=816 RepID=A0A414HDD1_BACT4|nr:site-specific integrase [Bacteroides thetaiotaomicron]RGQ51016.1 site-specific integrase [Bacteroides uniformis]RHC03090.1 site-specific integrase [Bacteroides uniformis]RHD82281.1 site-specific integrase [Bacteroides thetaiotaomicron]